MEYKIYIFKDGAYELIDTVDEMPENTDGLHIEAVEKLTGTTTIIKTIEP